jgi:subtilisin family serine protease
MSGTERQYSAGTVEHSTMDTRLYAASGKKSGHGTIAWLPAPSYEMPDGSPWLPGNRPPVIALLDTGVRQHPWLPADGATPFILHSEAYGWQSPLPDDDAAEDYNSHWGHATFICGLIRLTAPGAQVLSMRVMDSNGKVSEGNAASALKWLVDHPGVEVDIVLMAFGRQEDPANRDLDEFRTPVSELAGRGVRVIASAGNDGTERPVYPAAFAIEPGLSRSVVSVGALATPVERARYSNFGPWVTQWQNGTNIISIMPLTTKSSDDPVPGFDPAVAPARGNGYAWWSGTSFAAAIAAGHLATGLALPDSAAGS